MTNANAKYFFDALNYARGFNGWVTWGNARTTDAGLPTVITCGWQRAERDNEAGGDRPTCDEGWEVNPYLRGVTPICQQISAANDGNGNGRRLWVVYDCTTGEAQIVLDGYAGKPLALHGMVTILGVTATVSEFNSYKRLITELPTAVEYAPGDDGDCDHDWQHAYQSRWCSKCDADGGC